MKITKKQLIKLIKEQVEEQEQSVNDLQAIKITRKKFIEIPKTFGIVILGAGGKLLDWINGINDLWIEEKIVPKNITPINWVKRAYLLSDNVNGSGGRKDLVIEMKNVPGLSVGRLSMWRLRFGSVSWIDDFIVNYQKDYISINSQQSQSLEESNEFEESVDDLIDNQMLFNLPFVKKLSKTIYRKHLNKFQ